MQALRFGIGEGAELTVEKSIKGGPVIVVRNHLEIAIGRSLAEAIEVKYV
jgi:Fe2+ transport system protein FeoA